MTDLEHENPFVETNVKLCAAVKKHKCLHDKASCHKYISSECEAAWQLVALECNETIAFCKNRWRSLRQCFYQSLKRRGTKYYLHEHLAFLQGDSKKKSKHKRKTKSQDATDDASEKTYDGISLYGSEKETVSTYDDDTKSVSSVTSGESMDESKQNNQMGIGGGIYIIDELEDQQPTQTDQSYNDTKRLSYNRRCKRPLDPEIIDELAEEESEEKRFRPNNGEKCKTLSQENITLQSSSAPQNMSRKDNSKKIVDTNTLETNKDKKNDRATLTDLKQTKDVATQSEPDFTDYDNIFWQSIKIQMKDMNARQKMNFKRKIYESLLEVFDDSADFPKINETLKLPNKQGPPRFLGSTIGELRLMRELVSLVQAAKTTPEVMDATEKIKITTPVQNKSTVPTTKPIVENSAKTQSTPLLVSPSLDDDDLEFVDNDDEDVPLPRTWEEIKAKPSESTKATTESNMMKSLPRQVLQKVVKVSGSGTSTIVTRDGDKKRIYRIYPKMINSNPNESRTLIAKNSNSFGTFFVAKNAQEHRNGNEGSATSSPTTLKHIQDKATVPTTNNSVTVRNLDSKSRVNAYDSPNSVNKNSPTTSSNVSSSFKNGQTSYKNIQPANRVTNSSTGHFKNTMLTNVYKASSSPSTPPNINSTSNTKALTNKLLLNSMLPPTSNTATKRNDGVRIMPQIMQRRFSICGPLPAEKSIADSSNALKRPSIPTNSTSSQQHSLTSKIKISNAVTLNRGTTTQYPPVMPSIQQNILSSSNTNEKTAGREISQKTAEDPIFLIDPVTGITETAPTSTSLNNEAINTPILETAGTVEADDLDPLFVKPLPIKSEPID